LAFKGQGLSGGVTAKSDNKEQWALHLESAHDIER